MRNILLVLLPLLLLGCTSGPRQAQDPIDFLPEEAGLILKLDNPDLFFSNLKNNSLLKSNETHPLPAHLREQLSFLSHFSHKEPALLSFTPLEEKTAFSFITKGLPKIDSLDSVKNRKVESLRFEGHEIIKYTLDERVTYASSVDSSIFLLSDSRELLSKSLEGRSQVAQEPDFQRALKAASDKNPSLLINHDRGSQIFNQLFPEGAAEAFREFSNWTALDVELSQSGIKLNGISTATAALPKLLNVFREVPPSALEMAAVTPMNSYGLTAIGFGEFAQLRKNLLQYRSGNPIISGSENATERSDGEPGPASEKELGTKKNTPDSAGSGEASTREAENSSKALDYPNETALMETATEAGLIHFAEASVFVVKPLEILGAAHDFTAGKEEAEKYRGISIYRNEHPEAFQELLSPLLSPGSLEYFLVLDRFLLFAADPGLLKEAVQAFQNQQTLAESEAYSSAQGSLSTEASLLRITLNPQFRERLSEAVAPAQRSATEALEVEEYPLSAIQFIYQDTYAHVHALMEKTNGVSSETGIKQEAAVHLDAPLATAPVFFSNHRSKGMDMAVQDQNNTLYLLSEAGEIFWKKKLESRILGEIQEVDLYKNGRIQLAFATQNKLHVVDRNGNPVKPFPLEFRDEITQPLALFDYSNTRNYRFVITQGREVFMFNSKGQRVKGFGFTEADDEIIQPPKHIRLGNRDYILIAEASGKLNILNRRGDVRVPVEEEFSFSENEWYEYQNQFVSTSAEGQLIKIDQKGAISREELGLAENHRIDVTPKTLVSLSENELSIKGKSLTLDYGLYTEPQIFYINNKLYISVTDLQAQRVYLFDSSGELLPDFPVFGTSTIDLGNADADARLELVVQGDEDGVLLYEIGS